MPYNFLIKIAWNKVWLLKVSLEPIQCDIKARPLSLMTTTEYTVEPKRTAQGVYMFTLNIV